MKVDFILASYERVSCVDEGKTDIQRDGGDSPLAGLQLNLSLIWTLSISVSSTFLHQTHPFLSPHSSLICYYHEGRGRRAHCVRPAPLKRMKAREDPGNVISKHNYISNGSPSMDDKWLRVLARYRITAQTLWTKTFGNDLENI